jgi:hypothetical protein
VRVDDAWHHEVIPGVDENELRWRVVPGRYPFDTPITNVQ